MQPLFIAVVENAKQPELGSVSIPFPIPDDKYENILRQLHQIDAGNAVNRDCRVCEIKSNFTSLMNLEDSCVNVDQLDHLAKRLDSFTDHEMTQFQAAAFQGNIRDIVQMIDLTFCCREVTVISDFNHLETAGKHHYLTVCGGAADLSNFQQSDFTRIALNLINSDSGEVTPFGVLYDNGMEIVPVYNGRVFPPYYYDPCEAAVILSPIDRPDEMELLSFPCADSKISRAKERLFVEAPEEFTTSLEIVEKMDQRIIDIFYRDHDLREHLATLNHLTKCCQKYGPSELDDFHTIVNLIAPRTPEDVLAIAEALEDFTVVRDVSDPEEYGRYIVECSGQYDLDPDLECYMNYDSFGEERVYHEEGVFVDGNYIAYLGSESKIEELFSQAELERRQEFDQQIGELGG